jgi:hypothetical protein
MVVAGDRLIKKIDFHLHFPQQDAKLQHILFNVEHNFYFMHISLDVLR